MKQTELRIGNFAIDELTKEYLKVIELSEEDIIFTVINREKFPLPNGWKAIPIKLTEEIFLKCGFELTPTAWVREYKAQINDSFILIIRNNRYYYIDAPNLELTSLHQLQNLYYSLIGEELEVNL